MSILQLVTPNILIPSLTEPFVVKDNFRVNTSAEAKVKISYLGDNFCACFLNQVV